MVSLDIPPLPEPTGHGIEIDGGRWEEPWVSRQDAFNDEQMTAYGIACWNAAIEAAAAKMADTLGSSFSANQIRKLKK